MPQKRVIRKYNNRRLYDTSSSRHVTLDDIRRMITAGDEVRVIDDRTEEDLTRAVLLQIVAAQEQLGTPVLSNQLLEAIIRFYGNPVQSMLTTYLEQSVGSLMKQQQLMQAEMAKALSTPMAPVAELARRNMELWSKMQASMVSAFGPTGTASEPPPAAEPEKPKKKRRR